MKREWHRESDWWLKFAVDAHMRSRFSQRWETQCWYDLLMWIADEPVIWYNVEWAAYESRKMILDKD